jgi:hypothetical protein
MPSNYVCQVSARNKYRGDGSEPKKNARRPGWYQMPIGCLGRCWCGETVGHEWEGKHEGQPHPRFSR